LWETGGRIACKHAPTSGSQLLLKNHRPAVGAALSQVQTKHPLYGFAVTHEEVDLYAT